MSDVMLHGVLNMPLPDDPSNIDAVTWVQWVARDKNGDLRAYKCKPNTNECCWYCEGLNWVYLDVIKIKRGTCDWKDSLQQRPVKEGEKQ